MRWAIIINKPLLLILFLSYYNKTISYVRILDFFEDSTLLLGLVLLKFVYVILILILVMKLEKDKLILTGRYYYFIN